MHLETFLYMLLQSEKLLPPPGTVMPNFRQMAIRARDLAVPNEWIDIPASSITLGMDDLENDLPDKYFGWDNEGPSRQANVHAFVAKARPITNGEYARYLEQNNVLTIPASWAEKQHNFEENELAVDPYVPSFDQLMKVSTQFLSGKCVRTVYGPVPLKYTLHWPVFASYDELAACAKWMNGRIPTLEEARSIYGFVKAAKQMEAENIPSPLISAVNGSVGFQK